MTTTPNKQTFDLVVGELAAHGMITESLAWMDRLKEKCVYDDKSFIPLLTACGKAKDVAKTVCLLMERSKWEFSRVTQIQANLGLNMPLVDHKLLRVPLVLLSSDGLSYMPSIPRLESSHLCE